MPIDVQPFLQWAAPILSAIIVTITTASINAKIAAGEKKRDEARVERDEERREREEWRERVEEQLRTHGEFIAERDDWFEWRKRIEREFSEQNGSIITILEAQCTQMRSDITHKVHRYMDDLQCASDEEKQSLQGEYDLYCSICRKYGIENHFVEHMVRQVMELPSRSLPSYQGYDRNSDD